MKAAIKITEIIERYFIEEPLLFVAFCSHQIVVNNAIETIRSGSQKIEYNENFVAYISQKDLNEYMKLELIRILLNHPYQRMKDFKAIAYVSSQMCINELYSFKIPIPKVEDIFPENDNFFKRQSMDFYYAMFAKVGKGGNGLTPSKLPDSNPNQQSNQEQKELNFNNTTNDFLDLDSEFNETKEQMDFDLNENNSSDNFLDFDLESIQTMEQNTELWGEDVLFIEDLNMKIMDCIMHQSHGSISNNLIEIIKEQIQHKLDYKNILKAFRSSLISSDRVLTRMKPNRRYGFLNMGSKYSFSTHLLIAVDTSGSISKKEIELAFTIINRFFKYGVKTIEFFAFDTEIKGSKFNIKKPSKEFEVKGRGGTNFQCVFDYAKSKPRFDGLIIITDGFAPLPNTYSFPLKKILWLFNNKKNYDELSNTFKTVGRCIWADDKIS
jgi:predicted metal-dependent peptidase